MLSTYLFNALLLITAFLVITSPTIAALDNGFAPCSVLSSLLHDKVSYPNDTTYSASILSYFFQEARLSPNCIVRPTSASDVSLVVNIMVESRKNNPNSSSFAVRSGGHTPFAGAANIHGGVTIDLRSMNSVDVSPDQSITTVGAGSIWKDVYTKILPLNLTILGARVAGLGVGGLITGGKFVPLLIKLQRTTKQSTRWNLVLFTRKGFCLRQRGKHGGRSGKGPHSQRQCSQECGPLYGPQRGV